MASLHHKDAISAGFPREDVDVAMRTGSTEAPYDAEAFVRRLDSAIDRGAKVLLGLQQTDGHWVFELEADATIPAEYVLLQH